MDQDACADRCSPQQESHGWQVPVVGEERIATRLREFPGQIRTRLLRRQPSNPFSMTLDRLDVQFSRVTPPTVAVNIA